MTDRVKLLLRGRMNEKFIGCAVQTGICFEQIERIDARQMRLTVTQRDAKRLLALAEEYQMDLTVTGEEGRPLWGRRLRDSMPLLPGLVLCALLIYGFCARIWRVDAVSLDGMTDEQTLRLIEQYAAEQGVYPGVERADIDRDALAMDIQLRWSDLTYVSVRRRGVYLQIEVAAEKEAPNVYDISDAGDLVALRDAVVLYVEPLAGKACVKSGDTVRRGQVLIRGEERIDTALTHRIKALGTVEARIWFEGECTLPLKEVIRRRTGESRVSSVLRLGGWEVGLSQAEDYPCQDVETECLPVGGLYLPVKIVRTIRWEVTEEVRAVDEALLRQQGEAWSLELARGQLPAEARESTCWTECIRREDVLIVRSTVEAQMNIAVERAELNAG